MRTEESEQRTQGDLTAKCNVVPLDPRSRDREDWELYIKSGVYLVIMDQGQFLGFDKCVMVT